MNMLPPGAYGVNANRRTSGATRVQCHHAMRSRGQDVANFSLPSKPLRGSASTGNRTRRESILLGRIQSTADCTGETYMDNFNKLTERAQAAIVRAQSIAREHSASEIDAEHLLSALLEDGDGVPVIVLNQLGVDV